MQIGKINIGSQGKKEFHDFRHDVSTTADNGFCQPTLVQRVDPRSSVDLNSHTFVRLAPMPCPTFGRIKVKQDTVYVPMKDVFTAFNEFISGNSVNNPNAGIYVPESVDWVYSRELLDMMMKLTQIDWSSATPATVFSLSSKKLFSQMFTMSLTGNFNPVTKSLQEDEINYLDLAVDPDSPFTLLSFYDMLSNLGCDGSDFTLHYPDIFSSEFTPPKKTMTNSLGFTINVNFDSDNGFGPFWYGEVIDFFIHSFFTPKSLFEYADSLSFPTELLPLLTAYQNMPEQFRKFFDKSRSSENADFSYEFLPNFIFALSENSFDWTENTLDIKFKLNFHLTPFGKRLMKIFTACGWNMGIQDFKCDLPKLYAYYKAWFDLYNVGRDQQWSDTHAFGLIHAFYDDPRTLHDKLYHKNDTVPFIFGEDVKFENFLLDLSMCCYNMDADPMTVATPSPLLTKLGSTLPFAGVSYPVNKEVSSYIYSGSDSANQPQYPQRVVNTTYPLDSLSVRFLSRLYEYVNKESVIANKIADYMNVKYGVDIRSTAFLKRTYFDCQISDIMGTVNNDQTALGEYAGKGIGSGDTGDIHFDVPEQGFIIQLTTIVPIGGYVQANEVAQIQRYDFFTPEFDSLGMEPMALSQIFARDSIFNCFVPDKTFGFRPRYFSLKYKNNLNNGGFAFRSERASFLPYSLDRIFTESYYMSRGLQNASGIFHQDVPMPRVDLYPDERLRSLGLVESYGNYNRIFYDTTGISDNFIIHMIQDLKYYSPMKSISDSFDTYDQETDDHVKPVEHV